MGSYRSKNFKVDVESLPILEPEPNYKILTRQPMPDLWALNIFRGQREDELKGLAYAYARRKCKHTAEQFIECQTKNGAFWSIFECQTENYVMLKCFSSEADVEMDKLRRNTTMNNEWWWRLLYDENGEVGEQAIWKDEFWMLTRMRPYLYLIQESLGLQVDTKQK